MVNIMLVVTVLILAVFAGAPLYRAFVKNAEAGAPKAALRSLPIRGSHSH
jgi:Tfp pilus assembly protein PilE